jgi:CheY-like chemotaxis protein
MKAQVLVVDVNPTYRRILMSAAQARGFQVLDPVHSATAAVDACTRLGPEVIVLDLHLRGEVDGFALCELLLDLNSKARLVAASSFAETGLVERAFHAGAHRCLRKPFRMDEALRLFEHLAAEFEPATA